MHGTLALLVGLFVGGFANIWIYRLPRDLSVVRLQSFCPACNWALPWYDTMPIVSFALLGGRCRNCREAIPPRYPIVELLTGCMFLAAWQRFGYSSAGFRTDVFLFLVIVAVFADIEERILPDETTLVGLLLALISSPFALMRPGLGGRLFSLLHMRPSDPMASFTESFVGGLALAGTLYAFSSLYQIMTREENLGLGDVKLAAMIGAWMGSTYSLVIYLMGVVLMALFISFYWLASNKTLSQPYELPYSAFVGIIAIIAAVYW